MIDAYLKSEAAMDDHVIHLLFSANRWEAARRIADLLHQGTTVVCDRYYYSGMVYSAAKTNPLLPLSWARAPEVGLPRPDLVVFLDLTEEEARARGGWGDEIYEKAAMQQKVRKLFWGLSYGRIDRDAGGDAAADTDSAGRGGPGELEQPPAREYRLREEEEDLYVIDASTTVDAVSEAIWKVAQPRVAAVERGELGRTVRRVT